MEKRSINQKILGSLGFSDKERRVFDVLLNTQMARTPSRISRESGVARTTTIYILNKLEARKLVFRIKHGARDHWGYKKGLEFFYRDTKIDRTRRQSKDSKKTGKKDGGSVNQRLFD